MTHEQVAILPQSKAQDMPGLEGGRRIVGGFQSNPHTAVCDRAVFDHAGGSP
jgi:hypothetical protein